MDLRVRCVVVVLVSGGGGGPRVVWGVRIATFQGLVVVSLLGSRGREKEKDFCAVGGLGYVGVIGTTSRPVHLPTPQSDSAFMRVSWYE